MRSYINDSTDPYFNLAAEQYLLDTEPEPVFMLWRNSASVIIGRNQNAYAEIDREFVAANGIAVVRRLTGGGAVFHDTGNLNYTFIVPDDRSGLDFARFCAPVIELLRSLGVPAEFTGRNDMTADGRKFSGNAQCVYNGKVMHHGTLLFSADFSRMSGALCVDPDKMVSKGIKSVRSRVCNLNEYLPGMPVTGFRDLLQNTLCPETAEFSEAQRAGIERLRDEKYSTWEWNYGRSGQYGKNVKKRFPFGTVSLSYNSDRGRLTDVRFEGDFFGVLPVSGLEESLKGVRLEHGELMRALYGCDDFIRGSEPGQLCAMFED